LHYDTAELSIVLTLLSSCNCRLFNEGQFHLSGVGTCKGLARSAAASPAESLGGGEGGELSSLISPPLFLTCPARCLEEGRAGRGRAVGQERGCWCVCIRGRLGGGRSHWTKKIHGIGLVLSPPPLPPLAPQPPPSQCAPGGGGGGEGVDFGFFWFSVQDVFLFGWFLNPTPALVSPAAG